LKPIDTSAFYYSSAFQDTTMRPLDSLMHFWSGTPFMPLFPPFI
jgi:hypothetical protein